MPNSEPKDQVDWRKTPPFITSESGGDGVTYRVVVKVRDIHHLHAAHDLINKAFSDWLWSRVEAEYLDANQG